MRAAASLGCATLLWVAVAPANSRAADPTLPAELGQGGAHRADPQSLTAVATAPAMIAMDRRYSVDVAGRFGSQREQTWQAAISDSMTSPVALGVLFAYNRTIPDDTSPGELPGWKLPSEDLESKRMRMSVGGALAAAWLDEVVAAGINVFYHRTASTFVEANNAIDGGANVAVMLANDVYLSVVAENILPHKGFDDAPFRTGGGLRWAPQKRGGLELDVLTDLDATGGPALILNGGGSAWLAEKIWLAGGYELNRATGIDRASAGFGFGSDRAVLRYTFATPIGGTDDGFQSQHAVGLRFDF